MKISHTIKILSKKKFPLIKLTEKIMQLRFTVFNCGTGFKSSNKDVIADLWRETHSPKMINDGPGSHCNLNKVQGLMFGSGVTNNVQRTIKEIKRLNTTADSMVVNTIGWSRGAITCFKIANALRADPDTQNVKVNIFAIDPVPGSAPGNSGMWKDITIPQGQNVSSNIGMCYTILAQHDRRPIFSPYLPNILKNDNLEIMPGKHSDVVQGGDVSLLVKNIAKQFLISRGTVFTNNTLLSDIEILDKYSHIIETFDQYAKRRSFVSRTLWNCKSQRILKGDNKKNKGLMNSDKPPFFINDHHREIFAKSYQCLTNAIDKKSLDSNYNLTENWDYVKNDLKRLAQSPIHQKSLGLVVKYFEGQIAVEQ